MSTITRTLRIEVRPVGRRADVLGDDGLYRDLWGAMQDLTRAANLAISALYQAKLGTLPIPTSERQRGEKKGQVTPTPLQTLSYRALSGAWQPTGRAMYEPYPGKAGKGAHRRVSGVVLLGIAGLVYSRIQTDYLEILRGEKALSTFRELPLYVAGSGVEVLAGRQIRLSLWAKDGKRSTKVTFAPARLDAGTREILTRIVSGDYKPGDAKLAWSKPEGRKGKWYLSLAWTGPVQESTGTLFAGAHLDLQGITIAYVDVATGVISPERDRVDFPADLVAAWQRLQTQKRERLRSGREEYQRRTGHGVTRKLRSMDAITGQHDRLSQEIAKQTASAVVLAAKKRGAVGLAWDDLQDWSVQSAHRQADAKDSRAAAASHRRWYFQWRQGLVRAQIAQVAEREGLASVEASVAHAARDCANCRLPWRTSGVYTPESGDVGTFGRVTWEDFRCSCGWKCSARRNTACNVARRGFGVYRERQAAK